MDAIQKNRNTKFDYTLIFDSDLRAEPSLDACCCCTSSCCCTASSSIKNENKTDNDN